jgi:hypothetical protein
MKHKALAIAPIIAVVSVAAILFVAANVDVLLS